MTTSQYFVFHWCVCVLPTIHINEVYYGRIDFHSICLLKIAFNIFTPYSPPFLDSAFSKHINSFQAAIMFRFDFGETKQPFIKH